MITDIRPIRYFHTVARLKSYSAAARECYLSRQALTKIIQKMEHDLGGELFLANGRQLELTELGRAFFEASLPLLDAYDIFARKIEDTLKEYPLEVTLACSHGTFLTLDDTFLAEFRSRHPEIQVSVDEANSDSVIEQVRSGDAQIGLVGSVPAFLDEFQSQLLRQIGMWFLFDASHPLAKKEFLELSDFDGVSVIGAGRHNHQQRLFMQICRENGITPRFPINSSYMQAVLSDLPCQSSLVYSLPPEMMETPTDSVIKKAAIPGADELGTYAIARKGQRLSRAGELFWEFLKERYRPQ